MKPIFVFLFLYLHLMQLISADSYHVKVNGSSNGNGSVISPWDLQTALNQPPIVKGGDTIWVHKGIYAGVFVAKLKGSSNAPIVVRSIPGEEVILDGKKPGVGNGCLSIEGQYAYYWGFIITNTHGIRVEGTGAMDRKDGVYIVGPNNKLINCIIHNCGNDGIGLWSPALDSEIYGCIIYNNGYIGSDRGHGHGIYSQNAIGTKVIQDNILFNSFGLGIQIYTEGGSIQGFNVEGNIIFNSGLSGSNFLDRHILVGGLQPADRIVIKSNYIYNRPNYPSKAGIQLGYGAENFNAEVVNNYLVNASFSVMKKWNSIKVTGNTFASVSSDQEIIAFDDFNNIKSINYNNNKFYKGKLHGDTFDKWKSSSGQDKKSTYSASLPSDTYFILQKNQYEDGRAHLVVYNWAKESSLNVDLSSVLELGSEYKIFDVSNFIGGPVASGKYNGSKVEISMNLTKVEFPFGNYPNKSKFIHTAPDFGVFLIESVPKINRLSFSQIEKVPLSIVSYYPNPTNDILAVDFYSPDNKKVLIDVIDSLGFVHRSEYFEPKEGPNKHILNLATFPEGSYFITISNENGSASVRVLKQNFVLHSDIKRRFSELI